MGSGTVITEPVKPTYHYGDVVTFTAEADPGWTFTGWGGDLTDTDRAAAQTITGNTIVTATFTSTSTPLPTGTPTPTATEHLERARDCERHRAYELGRGRHG